MNIIICDDSRKDREILIELLREYEQNNNQHFEIMEYNSGEELCQDDTVLQKCQIIFLDINMTDMDGLKAAMEIKKSYPKTPIVLVTAYMNYALEPNDMEAWIISFLQLHLRSGAVYIFLILFWREKKQEDWENVDF